MAVTAAMLAAPQPTSFRNRRLSVLLFTSVRLTVFLSGERSSIICPPCRWLKMDAQTWQLSFRGSIVVEILRVSSGNVVKTVKRHNVVGVSSDWLRRPVGRGFRKNAAKRTRYPWFLTDLSDRITDAKLRNPAHSGLGFSRKTRPSHQRLTALQWFGRGFWIARSRSMGVEQRDRIE